MDVAADRFSYDQLHYVGASYRQTHPDTLAALGRLHGMSPAPVEHCRVLELACGAGNNLLPMAYALPGSTFVGLDLAAGPLATGQAHAAALGLTNLRLEARDLLDFPTDAGEFDYIIAHGFYSWCPPAVRDKLLAVCGAHLAPQGIAFVSFNAYPGYHAKDLQRQLMLFHLSHVKTSSAAEQARHAVGALDFVARAQIQENAYRAELSEARDFFAKALTHDGPGGLAWFHHDLLSDFNEPVYFHRFMDHAAGHGLQYLSDAVMRVPRVLELHPETRRALLAMQGDIVTQEQYLDFILNSPFRQALLCRQEVALDRPAGARGMAELYVAGDLTSTETDAAVDAVGPNTPQTFSGPQGGVTVEHADAKTIMRRLGAAWPGAVAFRELLSCQAETDGGESLARFVLRLYVGKLAVFRTQAWASALVAGERPEGSAVARLQARAGSLVTNLYHERIELAVPARHLLGLLDGRRTRTELAEEMRAWVLSGEAAKAHQQALDDPAASVETKPGSLLAPETLSDELDAELTKLARSGLLIR